MKRILLVSVFAMVAAAGPASADPVTSCDLLKAQDNSKEWLAYGRDYRNWRFSPLSEITPENASKLAAHANYVEEETSLMSGFEPGGQLN